MLDKINPALIFDILIGISLLITLIVGISGGFAKSLKGLITSCAGVIALFIFMVPVSNAIIDLDISFLPFNLPGATIRIIVMDFFQKNLNGGEPIVETSAMYGFATGTLMMLMRIIVLYLGLIVNFIIVKPILSLILGIFIKKRYHVGFFSRIFGLAFSALKFTIMFCLTTLPLFGIITYVNTYEEDIYKLMEMKNIDLSKISEEEAAQLKSSKEILDVSFKSLHEFDNSYTKKALIYVSDNIGTNVEEAYLSYLLTIKTPKGNFDIINEKPLIKSAIRVSSYLGSDDLNDVIEGFANEKDIVIQAFKETKVIEVIFPVALEYINNNMDVSKYEDILTKLEKVNWNEEQQSVASVIETVLNFLANNEFDINNPLNVFNIDGIELEFEKIGTSLSNSKIFTEILIDKIDEFIEKNLNDAVSSLTSDVNEIKFLNSLLDVTSIEKDNWGNDFKSIALCTKGLSQMGVFDKQELDIKNGIALENIVKGLFGISLVKGNEEKLFRIILDKLGVEDTLQTYGIIFNYENIDWSIEPVYFASFASSLLNVIDDATSISIENRDMVANMLNKANLSSLVKPNIKSIFVDYMKKIGFDYDYTDLVVDDLNWKVELDTLALVYESYEVFNGKTSVFTSNENIDNLSILLDNAKNGVIASYIVGEMFEKQLIDFYHDDITALIEHYDLRKQEVLASSSSELINSIKFGNTLKSYFELPTEDRLIETNVIIIANALANCEEQVNDKESVTDYFLAASMKYAGFTETPSATELKSVSYQNEANKLKEALIMLASNEFTPNQKWQKILTITNETKIASKIMTDPRLVS